MQFDNNDNIYQSIAQCKIILLAVCGSRCAGVGIRAGGRQTTGKAGKSE